MSQDYQLNEALYLLPTAAGAFHAVSGKDQQPIRNLLFSLLKGDTSPQANVSELCQQMGDVEEDDLLELLYQGQSAGWIEAYESPHNAPDAQLSNKLTELLADLSSLGKALLVDSNGLAVARAGVDHATAEVLSALGADLAALQDRHAARLEENLGLATQGWGAVDAFGSSRIAAWPLYIGSHRFLLVLMGEPRLNQKAFITLVWLLVSRYGKQLGQQS